MEEKHLNPSTDDEGEKNKLLTTTEGGVNLFYVFGFLLSVGIGAF